MKINSWDIFYLNMARYMTIKSKDPSTKSGAVIVRPDRSLCSAGFNGFPQGMNDDSALYADRDKKYSRVVHCEINAQIFTREDLHGYTLYTWPFGCCDRCAVQMIQCGIQRFVFPECPVDKQLRWGANLALAVSYMLEAKREVVEVPLVMIPDIFKEGVV